MSPIAVSYSALGIMMGFAIANLLRFSWIDLPRMAIGWMRGHRRHFMLLALGCLFGGILLFY